MAATSYNLEDEAMVVIVINLDFAKFLVADEARVS